jgi:hypothetical protein
MPTTAKTAAAHSPNQRPGVRALFPYERWAKLLPDLAVRYKTAAPYPHIHLGNLLDEDVIAAAAEEFPKPHETEWTQYHHFNEKKLGNTKREQFPRHIGQLVDELNSTRFVEFLSRLTGIPELLPDPMLEGGGMHQITSGGFLNIHADFSHHHYHPNWRRRCNLLIYLNRGWHPDWGGALELWDKTMTNCVRKILPEYNHAVIFNTDTHSFHGHPDPLGCPSDVYRRSLALYYYTVDDDSTFVSRSTDYRSRPSDSKLKATLIWLDKQALHLYSRAKVRLGFSDRLFSRAIQFFARDE